MLSHKLNSPQRPMPLFWYEKSGLEDVPLRSPGQVPQRKLPCKMDGCERRRAGRGLCGTHWARWRRHGDPTARPRRYWTPREDRRLLELIEDTEHGIGPAKPGEVMAVAERLERTVPACRSRLARLRKRRRAKLRPGQLLAAGMQNASYLNYGGPPQ